MCRIVGANVNVNYLIHTKKCKCKKIKYSQIAVSCKLPIFILS